MKTIVLTTAAARDLDKLPEDARDSVTEALTECAISGNGDVKKLSGREGCRMRVGDYRIIVAEDQTTILAIYVGRRSTTIYKRN